MTTTIDLGDSQQGGAYLVAEADLDPLDATAHAQGYLVRRISLAGCGGKADLLQRVATALAFPATFGGNWDALADSLGDLAWLPQAGGYAWLFDHAEDLRDAAPRDFDVLRAVLADTCACWRERSVPCFAFLALADLPSAGEAVAQG